MGRYSPESLRAAWWTLRAISRARGGIREADFGAGRIPPPPLVGPNADRTDAGRTDADRAVRAVLRRRSATCLVQAVVLQSWYAGQGDRRDLIVGVTSPADGFRAHAWIDGDERDRGEGFVELLRRPPG